MYIHTFASIHVSCVKTACISIGCLIKIIVIKFKVKIVQDAIIQ